MRPAALLLAHEATGGEVRRALPAAAAVELVHNFSLLHDDIEDASERRRDRATVWTFAGIPQAINAGDGMFTIARLAMHRLETRALDAGTILGAMRELDEACLRLVEGQYLDIAFEQREQVSPAEYIEMTCGKTAALFASSFAIGALLAEAPPETVASFRSFGRHLGVAFQAIDDVLGIWGDPAVTGKPVGDDLRARKMTFPVLAAIQAGGTAGDRVGEAYRRRTEPLEAEQIADLATAVEAAGGRKAADDLARTELDAAIGCLSSLELADEDRNLFAAFAALATRRSA